MCGIVGFIDFNKKSTLNTLQKMGVFVFLIYFYRNNYILLRHYISISDL